VTFVLSIIYSIRPSIRVVSVRYILNSRGAFAFKLDADQLVSTEGPKSRTKMIPSFATKMGDAADIYVTCM